MPVSLQQALEQGREEAPCGACHTAHKAKHQQAVCPLPETVEGGKDSGAVGAAGAGAAESDVLPVWHICVIQMTINRGAQQQPLRGA